MQYWAVQPQRRNDGSLGTPLVSAPPVSFATTPGILSSPQGTEMFQFPRCPPTGLCVHPGVTRYHPRRVAPFGFPRLSACPQLPEAFRRVATSFIGLRRQGIHRVPSLQSSLRCLGNASLVSIPPDFTIGMVQDDDTMLSLVSSIVKVPGGAAGIRTPDLRRAKAALSRLSYSPVAARRPVGVRGLEPRASPLSGVCSNQLS